VRAPGRRGGACDGCLRRTWLVARLAAAIELARQPGAGPARGRLRELLALPDDQLLAVTGPDQRAEVERELEAIDPATLRAAVGEAELTAVCRHDAGYPRRLLDLDDAPAVLHVASALPGRLAALVGGGLDDGPGAVAVVGTRRASADGLEVARSLGSGLAAAGVTVVSGMALGADSAAHAGALETGGRTLAVLAGGADVPYPASKRALYRRIASQGAAVSEMPPGFRAHRWCFPARNRIIAALAQTTVVVEAAERSGSLITAECAADLGRDVGAVPGPVGSWRSAGTNALLRDGAAVIRHARDVLDSSTGVQPAVAPTRLAGLEPRLLALVDAVDAGRDTVAAIARHPLDVGDVVAGLTELELLGVLRRVAGGRYVRAAAA
jgi:DNA processing protein